MFCRSKRLLKEGAKVMGTCAGETRKKVVAPREKSPCPVNSFFKECLPGHFFGQKVFAPSF